MQPLDTKQVTKTRCLNWAATLGKDACPSVFNHTIATLRRVLEVAIECGALCDNPASFIKRHKEKPKSLQLPTPANFQRFVEKNESGKVCSCYLAADPVRFFAFGGFRKSEARHITWADCDFEKEEITVRGDLVTGTKNNEVRRVPMISEMMVLLKSLRKARSDEELGECVMKIHECQVSMDRAAKALRITRLTHHDLRHLFATRCIESGADIPTVSRWLGH